MSGLLLRLASRALGVAPAIRPILAWPPAGARVDAVPRPQEPQQTDPLGSPAAAPAPAAPARRTAALHAAARPLDVGDGVEVAVASASLVPDVSRHDPAPAYRQHEDDAPDNSVAYSQARADRVGGSADFAHVPAPHAPDAAPLRNTTAADDAPRRDRRAHPEPLLAPRAAPRTASSGALPPAAGVARSRAATAPAGAAEDVTEVHVTIGRIELTAVQEAPRPRLKSARSRKPQSLDEYLARRAAERR